MFNGRYNTHSCAWGSNPSRIKCAAKAKLDHDPALIWSRLRLLVCCFVFVDEAASWACKANLISELRMAMGDGYIQRGRVSAILCTRRNDDFWTITSRLVRVDSTPDLCGHGLPQGSTLKCTPWSFDHVIYDQIQCMLQFDVIPEVSARFFASLMFNVWPCMWRAGKSPCN